MRPSCGGTRLRCEIRSSSTSPTLAGGDPAPRLHEVGIEAALESHLEADARALAAVAAARSPLATSSESGFSQNTCFPARAACSTISAWSGLGVAITTAATRRVRQRGHRRRSTKGTPSSPPAASASARSWSTTQREARAADLVREVPRVQQADRAESGHRHSCHTDTVDPERVPRISRSVDRRDDGQNTASPVRLRRAENRAVEIALMSASMLDRSWEEMLDAAVAHGIRQIEACGGGHIPTLHFDPVRLASDADELARFRASLGEREPVAVRLLLPRQSAASRPGARTA